MLAYYVSSAAIPTAIVATEELETQLVPDQVVIAELSSDTAASLAQVQRLGARLIGIRKPGDAPIDAVVPEVALSWPIVRAEFEEILKALIEGSPLSVPRGAEKHEPQTRFLGLRVLVADDNEINQEVAKEALEQLGATTTIVCDGAEAVATYAASLFDIVFLDGSMPVLDGFQAARRIRQKEAESGLKRTPIVALTAHVLGSRATDWIDAGMDALLAKPFTLDQLRRCIESMLPSRGISSLTPPQTLASLDTQDLMDQSTFDELERLSQNGKSDFLGRIMRLYLEHAPSTVANLERLAAEQDLEGLAKTAHALKSMSLNIGARLVAFQASRIELDAKNSRPPAYEELMRLREITSVTCKLFVRKSEESRSTQLKAAN